MSKKYKKFAILFLLFFIFFIFIRNKKSSTFLNKNKKMFNIIKHELQGLIKKNINSIDSLYITGTIKFGNFIISINNAILFCELFHCKRIIIQSSLNNKSLRKSVVFFYYLKNFIPLGNVNRFHILKEEILNNLPKVKVNHDDLFIYIRGGDVFQIINRPGFGYAQPPLCFYRNILNKFKFRGIRIISIDKSNPVLTFLEQFYHAKYAKNDIKLDISYLANSYNIISAKSSFIISIIKLNNNVKFVWEYDFYLLSERYFHLHYSVYSFSFKYIIYKMKASENYKKFMTPFINSINQRELMIKEKCDDHFYIIPPRIL